MPANITTEDHVEQEALKMLADEGWKVVYGPEIAPTPEGNGERASYKEVVLVDRLREAIKRINPGIPEDAREEALKKVLRHESQDLISDNKEFHKLLFDGVDIEHRKAGRIAGDKVWLMDFENPEKNEFLAINQFTIVENDVNRRPDILLFVNGLPLVLFELKNPSDEKATVMDAFNQVETYKKQISSLFRFNEIIIISDGMETLAGTLTSGSERFNAWKTINGKYEEKKMGLEVLIKGMLNKKTILDLIRNFIVFQEEKDLRVNVTKISKKIAAYHQYNAVNKAVENTVKATKGDKRAGIVWHTQGSGKSLTMVFYTGKLVLSQELENPTIVVLTDRNDLDDQLFDTFASCHNLLRQTPVQSEKSSDLKKLLKVASGGIVFTTIQKFFPEVRGDKYPELSNRKNIIVLADEAHRSQYNFMEGFAGHIRDALPNASFIGFTGTPIEKKDRSTPAVFGKYIDVYDIERSKNDKMTVGIFYESRLAKVELKPEERLKIDPDFEEITEGEELTQKEKLKSKWARMEAVIGSKERIKRVAKDIVDHFEQREVMKGKAMIVCMSRRICVELHDEIVKLKPEWYDKDDSKGNIKVIMTGSAKDSAWQEHIRNKLKRKAIGDRMKDPSDPLKITIVRDMWLTGFDVPCLHTMYIDKPMKGHGLMQAIARVNRVFKDKTGGLIVDYIGLYYELQDALKDYTASGGKGKPVMDQEEAVKQMLSEHEVVKDLLHGFEYKSKVSSPLKERLPFVNETVDFILKKDREDKRKERFLKHSKKLIELWTLANPNPKALAIKDEISFFQLVKARLTKLSIGEIRRTEDLDSAIRQIVSKAVVSDRIIDIFESVGFKKPNMDILSNEFLLEVKRIPQKNLAFEALKKLVNEEIKLISRKNVVKGRSFMEMLDQTIKKYHNKAIETAQLVEELINLAKTINKDKAAGKELGLTEDEVAFYDALEVNDSAVKVLGDETLMLIARELVKTIHENVSIDWTIRENIRANLRVKVKRVLNKYGYPPDKQKIATETVLKQAEVIAQDWVEK